MGIARRTTLLAPLALTLTLGAAPTLFAQTYPPASDPRNGLKAGQYDAGEAINGMRLVSFTRKPAEFDSLRGLTFVNSDLAFRGNLVYQGNFAGFSIWDISNPAAPTNVAVVSCITSQGDPTIVGNLLFISTEGAGNRKDCAKGGVKEPSEHTAGVRIFDVSDPKHPRLVKNVETCKGSHTHTLIPSPTDKGVVYLYVSGSQGARPETELAGCKNGSDPNDTTNSLYRLDIIKVPLAHPEQAQVVTGARIFTNLGPAPTRAGGRSRTAPTGGGRGGRGGAAGGAAGDSAGGRGGRAGAPGDTAGGRGGRGGRGGAVAGGMPMMMGSNGPWNCHDVTSYPAMHLLAGACASYGLLVDVSNPERPVRLDAVSDTNFSLWHTAVFSNDASKVVFTDEWGGGTSPNCQATNMMEMGGDAILTIGPDKKMKQHAYFKIPSAQTPQENCVSHNGSLVPVPGRDIMVQGWYQGGIDVIDFTDPDHPFELAYFDRGPVDAPPPPGDTTGGAVSRMRGTIGGSWGAYYWNGLIYSSEMARGLDVLELVPSDKLSANEIAAAKLVRMTEFNPQSQPHVDWPAAFPVVRSYLDQLVRGNGLPAARTTAIASALDAAEKQSGAARRSALNALAAQVDKDVSGAKDQARVRAMASEIKRLAGAR